MENKLILGIAEQARNDVRLGGTVQRGQETIPTYTIGSNALQTIG
jgi:hypothetical protein